MSLTSKRIYQFGEFELRIGARILARDGKPVPLGSKAFEVLTCLVIHAGEVVTKDELLKTVWPESFVEEGNLSQHIFALRKALGDRAKFIVTIPGRGYQFTETVREVTQGPPSPLVPGDSGSFVVQRTRERTHVVIEETAATQPGQEPFELPPGRWGGDQPPITGATGKVLLNSVRASLQVAVADSAGRNVRRVSDVTPDPFYRLPTPSWKRELQWAGAVLLGVAVAAGSFLWWRSGRVSAASQKIVLADFDNRTGDTDFDVSLKKALAIDLDQSPYMEVMTESEALGTLQLMDRKPDTAFTSEVAREVCVRSNRQVLITGSITRLAQEYLLTLEATDCGTAERLADARAEAASKEEALAALDSAADKLRRGLGESAQSVERFQVPVAQATTPSLEALKQYSTGEYLLGRTGAEENEVLPYFQKAVQLDPKFAMAYAAMATGYHDLGEQDLAVPYYQKAFDLSEQVSEKERLYIRAHYYADDVKDVEQGIKAYQMWAAVYPHDWGPWLDIANEYTQLGQYDHAIAAGEQALKLDPSRGIAYSVLARAYLGAGRDADARSTVQRALAMGKDSYLLHATLFEIAFLEQDAGGMSREIDWSRGKKSEWDFLTLEAFAAASEGRLNHAEELFHSAYDAAAGEDLPETADEILIDQASVEFDAGRTAAAQATLRRVKHLHEGDPELGFLEAELGDVSIAEHALAVHETGGHPGTLATYLYGPRIRAAIALDEAKPLDAIADLGPAADYDLAGGFSVIAERGEAYLRAKQPEKAAVEYKKILDHGGVDPVSPLLPLARLDLARAEAQGGHVDESRADYEKLFALWKDADADLPVLAVARKEGAALSGGRR
jgi:eukaryotic-like serine/threonine-protein kinase